MDIDQSAKKKKKKKNVRTMQVKRRSRTVEDEKEDDNNGSHLTRVVLTLPSSSASALKKSRVTTITDQAVSKNDDRNMTASLLTMTDQVDSFVPPASTHGKDLSWSSGGIECECDPRVVIDQEDKQQQQPKRSVQGEHCGPQQETDLKHGDGNSDNDRTLSICLLQDDGKETSPKHKDDDDDKENPSISLLRETDSKHRHGNDDKEIPSTGLLGDDENDHDASAEGDHGDLLGCICLYDDEDECSRNCHTFGEPFNVPEDAITVTLQVPPEAPQENDVYHEVLKTVEREEEKREAQGYHVVGVEAWSRRRVTIWFGNHP